MASWRSYYKRRYRRYYRNKYKNSYGKRSYGNMKAAKQQADQAAFVMNIPTSLTCKAVKANGEERGTFALNMYDLLRKNEFYQSYANMYDEFKIDNIKVKLIPTKYNVTVGDTNSAGYQSFTVYTAWDRTGLNSKQLHLITNGVFNDEAINDTDPDSPRISGKNRDYIGKGDYDGLYCIVGSDIATYSSAESRQISVGQNSSIVRWLKPKTIQEKGQWLSTAQLEPWYYHYSDRDCAYTYIPTFSTKSVEIASQITNIESNPRTVTAALSTISPAVANNPCFLEEDPSINFKPTLLVGLYPFEDGGSLSNPRAVTFNVEAEIACSFRGLRRSKVVSSSSDTPSQTKVIQPLTTTVTGDGVTNIVAPAGVDGYTPIQINHKVNFQPGMTLTNNGYYRMVQNTDPTSQQNYFSPILVPDTDSVLANFRIDVPTVQTATAFCVGDNNVDTKELNDPNLNIIDSSTSPQLSTIPLPPASYIFVIDVESNNVLTRLYLGVNNSDEPKSLNLSVNDPNITRYAYPINNYYGDGDQTTPIPTTVSIKNQNHATIWSFGQIIPVADESSPTERYVFSECESLVRNTFVNFDFGTMNTSQVGE